VSGGGAVEATATETVSVTAQVPPFGIADFSTLDANAAGGQDTQAGDHPSALVTTFDINTVVSPDPSAQKKIEGVEDLKDVVIDLPLGLVGDAQATPKCPAYDLTGDEAFRCPPDTFIGTIAVNTPGEGFAPSSLEGEPSPIVNVQPEAGYPAQFGFTLASKGVMLYAKVVSTSSGYVLQVTSPGITRVIKAKGAKLTFFGDPLAQEPFGNRPGTPAAFFTNPTDCAAAPQATTIYADSWENPAAVPLNSDGSPNFAAANFGEPQWKKAESPLPPVTGCERVQFNPTIEAKPETTQADTSSGYQVDIKVPQNEEPAGLATSTLKNASVTLPAGVALNPSSAYGLQGCTNQQIGFDAQTNAFSTEPSTCPGASKIGTVAVETPLLAAHSLTGSVYLAQPTCGGAGERECTEELAETGQIYGLYLEIEGSGVRLKLRGSIEAGGYGQHSRETGLASGQLRTRFGENPQIPFSELRLQLKGGARAPLANPQTCGTFETTALLEPWSHAPASGEARGTPNSTPSSLSTVSGCPNPSPFAPSLSAGTLSPEAGAYSPFTFTLKREDGEQNISSLSATLPPGLLAAVSHISQCPEPQASSTRGGCPASSQVGTTIVAVGSGSNPYYFPGTVYFTGPYDGAPFGLSVLVPALAGPFNLGAVLVRIALYINPVTAQVTAISNTLPQIIDGVPLRLRTISLTLNAPQFTFNPTSCAAMAVTGTAYSTENLSANVSAPFVADGCRALPFKPSFTASTTAHTSRALGASLTVKITYPAGSAANLKSVDLQLPSALPTQLKTLNKACTEAQFINNPAGCPPQSDVAQVVVHTPVLTAPLAGPAYLVSHGNAAFPDVEMVLQGEGVKLIVDGTTQIKKGITYSHFDSIPDAPISSFEFTAHQGPYALFAAYGRLCEKKLVLPTSMVGQNGAVVRQETPVEVTGCSSTISVVSSKVQGRALRLAIYAPGAGRLIARGNGLTGASRTYAGREVLTVTLRQKKSGKLATNVALSFTPRHGKKQTKSLNARFR
jgi:hypothetical protein